MTAQAHRYDQALMGNFAIELAEFLNMPLNDVSDRLEIETHEPGRLVADAWTRVNPSSSEEVHRFYQETDAYLFDLVADHCRDRRRSVWATIASRIQRHGSGLGILMFGDGIGTDALCLAGQGHRVSYFDLPGITSSFAQFRFQRAGLGDRIQVIQFEKDIPESAFSVVVSIEVLEHLTDPVAAMKRFHRSLKIGGIAVITESFGSIGPEYPSHLPANSQFAGLTHRLMEEIGFASTFYNKNPINYPMEFTKVAVGLRGGSTRLWYKSLRAVECRYRRFFGSQNKSTSSH